MSIRYIDLFAGIGGFHYGLDRCNTRTPEDSGTVGEVGAGLEKESQLHAGQLLRQRFDCVYSNEWDKYANSVYRKHYGECDDRDIRTVKSEDIPDFDLMVGGVPCQSWSVAGKRGGFSDERGNLWFEFIRILKEKKPKYFVAENVKGILSHDGGKSFEKLCESFCEAGYVIDFEILNSKDFGVAQNRERVYIIGFREDILDKCQIF